MSSGGHEQDFGAFYAKYAPLVRRSLLWRGVRREDLDDVVQDAFITIQRLLPTFEGRASIETWLHAVIWRVAATHQRQSRRQERPSDRPERTLPDVPTKSSPDRSFHALLGELDEHHRDVIVLHELAELSISELSVLTGNARATVRDRLDRGRRTLRRRLESTPPSGAELGWLDRLAPQSAARLSQLERPSVQSVLRDGNAITTLDDVAIVVWRGPSSVASLEALLEVLLGLLERYPEGVRLLSVVERTATLPQREARQLMAWGMGKIGHKLRAAAWAIENPRMMPATAAIVNACMFVGGVPINTRVFEGTASAACWLGGFGERDGAPIAARVADMQAQLSWGRGRLAAAEDQE